MQSPRRVLVVGYPAAGLFDVACVVTALQRANQAHGQALHSVGLACPGGGPITKVSDRLLIGSDLAVEAIAGRCGFGTVDTMRQAFQRRYGVSPSHFRATQSPALGQGPKAAG